MLEKKHHDSDAFFCPQIKDYASLAEVNSKAR